MPLTFADVLDDRLRVHSPKTEHHGQGVRYCPILPELRPLIDEVYDQAAEGQTYLIARHRNVNHRTMFAKIVARAGVAEYPKLFHALRATRATELAARHPAHVAAAWLRHSVAVASKSYWQVTDADYARAAGLAPATAETAR